MDTRIVIVVVVLAVVYALFPHECWEQRRRRLKVSEALTTGVVIVVHELEAKHALPARGQI